jgi:cytochrome bd-type quinol oxidase subunit 1
MGVATGITMEFQFGTNWAYDDPAADRRRSPE